MVVRAGEVVQRVFPPSLRTGVWSLGHTWWEKRFLQVVLWPPFSHAHAAAHNKESVTYDRGGAGKTALWWRVLADFCASKLPVIPVPKNPVPPSCLPRATGPTYVIHMICASKPSWNENKSLKPGLLSVMYHGDLNRDIAVRLLGVKNWKEKRVGSCLPFEAHYLTKEIISIE